MRVQEAERMHSSVTVYVISYVYAPQAKGSMTGSFHSTVYSISQLTVTVTSSSDGIGGSTVTVDCESPLPDACGLWQSCPDVSPTLELLSSDGTVISRQDCPWQTGRLDTVLLPDTDTYTVRVRITESTVGCYRDAPELFSRVSRLTSRSVSRTDNPADATFRAAAS